MEASQTARSEAANILEARGLRREFLGFVAVDDVNLDVPTGAIHALIGPNGAGKTTCFNLLSKFIAPSAGTIQFDGRDITTLEADQVARIGMSRSFQISAVFGNLTVLENVRLSLQARDLGNAFDFWRSRSQLKRFDEEAYTLIERVRLSDVAHMRACHLPYGRKRTLEIAATLALSPKLLLLDEPTAGMTEEGVQQIIELISEIRAGRTVLMVEHNLSVVKSLCDKVTVLMRGRVIAEGNYDEVASDPLVMSAYLGTDEC